MSQFITKLITAFTGQKIGTDVFGNVYYKSKKKQNTPSLKKEKRWVIFKNFVEASAIPPLWHAWLQGTLEEAPLSMSSPTYAWQKPHLPNLTGTPYAYRPKGHTLKGGMRAKATGDYEKWSPEEQR